MAAVNVRTLKIFSLAIMLFENESFQCHFIYCPRNFILFNLECSKAALIFGSVVMYNQYCLSAASGIYHYNALHSGMAITF